MHSDRFSSVKLFNQKLKKKVAASKICKKRKQLPTYLKTFILFYFFMKGR